MAFSSNEGKALFEEWIRTMNTLTEEHPEPGITSVLDIGAGAGAYGKILRNIGGIITTAVEAFTPYIQRFDLHLIYDHVVNEEIIQFFSVNKQVYDLIVLGDVLEHFDLEQATRLMNLVRKRSKFAWISIPLSRSSPSLNWYEGYNQLEHEYQENPLERHCLDISIVPFKAFFGPFVGEFHFRTVSVFLIKEDLEQ